MTFGILVDARAVRGSGTRIAAESEATLRRIVEETHLTAQRRPAAEIVTEVLGRCRKAGLALPSANAVRRWIKALLLSDLLRRGEERPKPEPVQGLRPTLRCNYPGI